MEREAADGILIMGSKVIFNSQAMVYKDRSHLFA